MTAVSEDIFDEIEAKARFLNGEVVRRAFEQYAKADRNGYPGVNHRCCEWQVNQVAFKWLLERHLKEKRIAESARLRMLDPLLDEEKQHMPPWRIRQNRFAYAAECNQRRDEYRAELRKIWPCPDCMKTYNPTEGDERD